MTTSPTTPLDTDLRCTECGGPLQQYSATGYVCRKCGLSETDPRPLDIEAIEKLIAELRIDYLPWSFEKTDSAVKAMTDMLAEVKRQAGLLARIREVIERDSFEHHTEYGLLDIINSDDVLVILDDESEAGK